MKKKMIKTRTKQNIKEIYRYTVSLSRFSRVFSVSRSEFSKKKKLVAVPFQ